MSDLERHAILLNQAKKEIELADHLLYVTYPMIKEMKFLISISEHISKAAFAAMEALLDFEHKYKRIEAFSRNHSMMISTYKQKVEQFYGLDPKFCILLKKLNEIRKLSTNTNVAFRRGEKYVLASSDFKLTTIDFESIKRYNNITKRFVETVESILSKA